MMHGVAAQILFPAKKGRLFWIKKVIDNSAGQISIEIDYLKNEITNKNQCINRFQSLDSIEIYRSWGA